MYTKIPTLQIRCLFDLIPVPRAGHATIKSFKTPEVEYNQIVMTETTDPKPDLPLHVVQ
jgi:hypothetical protein